MNVSSSDCLLPGSVSFLEFCFSCVGWSRSHKFTFLFPRHHDQSDGQPKKARRKTSHFFQQVNTGCGESGVGEVRRGIADSSCFTETAYQEDSTQQVSAFPSSDWHERGQGIQFGFIFWHLIKKALDQRLNNFRFWNKGETPMAATWLALALVMTTLSFTSLHTKTEVWH